MTIRERGNPNGPTLDGQQTEEVHYAPKLALTEKVEPVCRTGAYNILYTRNRDEVTCPICIGRLDKSRWLQ